MSLNFFYSVFTSKETYPFHLLKLLIYETNMVIEKIQSQVDSFVALRSKSVDINAPEKLESMKKVSLLATEFHYKRMSPELKASFFEAKRSLKAEREKSVCTRSFSC